MADYTPIPTMVQQYDPMQKLSGLLNVANNQLLYKRNLETFDADVAARKAQSSSAQSAATVDAANVNPLIQQQAATTSRAQTEAEQSKFGLHKDYTNTALQTASGLLSDPRISGPNYNETDAAKALAEAQEQMVAKGVPREQAAIATAPFYMSIHTPGAVSQMLKNTVTGALSAQGQAGAIAPSGPQVSNGIQTGYVNTNPLAPQPVGSPVAGTTQTQLVPLGQQQGVGTDINGNPIVTSKDAYGNVQPPKQMPGSGAAPQISFPAGESPQTKQALEQEALGAKGAAQGAPQMHDINKTIVQEADNLKNGGTLGQLTQRLSSATGFNLGNESATGYNLLGKMLERSALTAAQSMGPHTNAGLEAAVRANGSLDYTPDALKTIARLNDALTTGSEKYATGMQAAIDNGGSVFAKRKFDQQWAQNADVNALKFLTASKNGDQESMQEVLKSVGGPGSKGAQKLAQQLKNLQSLTTKGSL